MKRTFILSLLIACAMIVKAQSHNTKVIITGVMVNPRGSDEIDGGYEYVQLLAVERIDFTQTPYAVIISSSNAGATSPDRYYPPLNGWVTGNADYSGAPQNGGMRNKTYKFELTNGVAEKGTYFYVGGAAKRIAGYWSSIQTTDISGANWIKTKNYATEAGDGGIGNTTTGLFANSGNPVGVAVFEGTAVTEASVPVDAVFIGTATNMTSAARLSTHNTTDYVLGSTTYPAATLGYRVPNSDIFVSTLALPFLGMGDSNQANRRIFVREDVATYSRTIDRGNFLSLGGVYDDVNKTWVTGRLSDYTYITLAEDAAPYNHTQTQFGLANIEATATKLLSVLPVVLTNFTAKNNGNTIKLNWATAQEKNNSYFVILRSTDGQNFSQIGTVGGNGNSQTAHHYSYTDNNPAAGTNYYQLKQVDNDGKFTLSNVVAANMGLATSALKAWAQQGIVNLAFNNATTAKTAEITLSDMAGKKAGTYKQEVGAGTNTLSFATPLQPGVYVLTLQLGSTQMATKLLIN